MPLHPAYLWGTPVHLRAPSLPPSCPSVAPHLFARPMAWRLGCRTDGGHHAHPARHGVRFDCRTPSGVWPLRCACPSSGLRVSWDVASLGGGSCRHGQPSRGGRADRHGRCGVGQLRGVGIVAGSHDGRHATRDGAAAAWVSRSFLVPTGHQRVHQRSCRRHWTEPMVSFDRGGQCAEQPASHVAFQHGGDGLFDSPSHHSLGACCSGGVVCFETMGSPHSRISVRGWPQHSRVVGMELGVHWNPCGGAHSGGPATLQPAGMDVVRGGHLASHCVDPVPRRLHGSHQCGKSG